MKLPKEKLQFWKGKHRSEETKHKIRLGNKGRIPWNAGLTDVKTSDKGCVPWNKGFPPERQPNYGKKFSEEHKEKMSNALKGKPRPAVQGQNHPNWQGGISFEPYGIDFNNKLKEQIKERDGHICRFPDCKTPLDLTVHHIDYDKKNNVPSNLITLCRRHNFLVNGDREYWVGYFSNFLT